ncbi:hypothetical protein LY90DRAFT_498842 [Neocallimastix californiae]|uniref:Uncharacterized protein n=1 Tax=Neocallimastix californiae TaxID=1754190 RepID=A0A1Y2FSN6_9FUNG|nr:hypothetical protein LY90DRAFT_498842 [Neocallimastix californiae]|eukprot:ORY86607.1 hypothetical protein LY90DRAFT_498842 [Neocallimastix californiae]
MPEVRYLNDDSTITKYMDLEPRPMSAPANLERSSINESDSESSLEYDENITINLKKNFVNIEKSFSQSNSPILKNNMENGIADKTKNKSKLMNNKKGSIQHDNDIEKDSLSDDNDIFDRTIGE